MSRHLRDYAAVGCWRRSCATLIIVVNRLTSACMQPGRSGQINTWVARLIDSPTNGQSIPHVNREEKAKDKGLEAIAVHETSGHHEQLGRPRILVLTTDYSARDQHPAPVYWPERKKESRLTCERVFKGKFGDSCVHTCVQCGDSPGEL